MDDGLHADHAVGEDEGVDAVLELERKVIGNLVVNHRDQVELMVLAADGKVEMLIRTHPLTTPAG